MPTEPDEQTFDRWLAKHARGTLNAEATAAIREVTKLVGDIGKKGAVVVEIVIEPAGAAGRTVAVGGKVSRKDPRPDPELSVYYPDGAGELHRNDPYQTRMETGVREETE